MCVRLFAKAFGGIWKLRAFIVTLPKGRLRSRLTRLHDAYWETYGAYIGLDARFGSRPVFPHGPFGVFVSGSASLGKECVIFQHVVVGSNTLVDSGGRGVPRVGDRCFLGAGAMLIGGIRVGHDVRVGANCVVATDIPDAAVVVGAAPRITVRSPAPNNRHYTQDAAGRWLYIENGQLKPETDAEVIRRLAGSADECGESSQMMD